MTFPESLWTHIPGWAAAGLLIVGALVWILSRLSAAHAGVAKLIPIMGKVWQRRSVTWMDGELRDLRRQVEFLTKQLEELRDRDEMYWAWILTDQEYHRQVEFMAIDKGWELPPHLSFMQFRDNWLASHPKREELPF